MGCCNKVVEKYGKHFYLLSRVLFGVVFFLHGWTKFAGNTPLMSLFGLAGVIEVVGGALLVLGFFTRGVAIVGAVEMIVAWFMAHAPQGWNPLANHGEPAVLFFAAFLVMIYLGNGMWSLEQALLHKEVF